MSRLTEAYGWRRGEAIGPTPEDRSARWQRIGRWYIGVGASIGAGVFVITLIGARASHAATTIVANILAGTLQPVPMIGLGLAIKRRRAWAPLAAMAFPVLAYFGAWSLQFLPLPGPNDFVNAFVHQIVGLQTFHALPALVLAGFVASSFMSDRLEGTQATAAEIVRERRPADPPSRWQTISRWYLLLGGLVGAPLFLLLLVGTQAAHSTAEMYLGMLLAVLQLAPMLLLAWAIDRWRPVAIWLAVAYPVAIGIGGLVLRTFSQPHRDTPLGYSSAYYFVYGQLYYLPFAAILAVVVLRAVVAERR